jgi:hypothetical protein
MGRTVRPKLPKRTLLHAGTPVYDSVVTDLNFDPETEPPFVPQHAAKPTRVRKPRTKAVAA